jgi:hypothetical protein
MARFSQQVIQRYFQQGIIATTMTEKGRALEDLICYVFEKVPGITVTRRNLMNVFETEEIDIGFWNEKDPIGLYFFPHIIIVECKNWSRPVGSEEVGYFSQKIQNRGLDYGILIAANGITGSSEDISRAHYEIAMALSRGIHIIVITKEEIQSLDDTSSLVKLLKEKLCDLAISGTVLLQT